MGRRRPDGEDAGRTDVSAPGLLLLTNDFGGGTGNHLLQIMQRWDLDRWKPEIVAGRPRTSRIQPPVPVTQLPPEAVSIYPVAQLLRLRRLAALMRSRRPKIVHTYFFWPIIYGRLLKMLGLIPRLVENREDMGFAWGRHEYAWLRWTRSLPDRVICVSDAVRTVAVEREGLEPDRATVIRNGVPAAQPVDSGRLAALRRDLDLPATAPVVGMVANLNRGVKGGDMFLRVASRVLQEIPDSVFLVVGLGGLDGPLEAAARRTGVHGSIRFTGYVEDVASYYELMDVSVLTSRTEGLSITLLESMSHGLPVVATWVGGNPEVVEEGETGWLVPVDDVEGFADRVVGVLRDEGLRAKMGQAARERVEGDFDIADVAGRYEAEYERLLAPAGDGDGAASGAADPADGTSAR